MPTSTPITLSDAQITQYREDGYLVAPDLLTPNEVDEFLAHETDPKTHKLGLFFPILYPVSCILHPVSRL